MTIMQWVNLWLGKGIDEDGAYGNQCWDLAAKYAREVIDCPRFPTRLGGNGNAIDCFNIFLAPLPQYFEKIINNPNNPNQIPQPGDIIFWSFNHCALVLDARPGSSQVKVFQQNAPVGALSTIAFMSYDRCVGWFAPKNRPPFEATAPADPSPAMPGDEFYTIRQGDTFYDLENVWHLPHGTLQSLNAAQNPRELRIGQQIRIRPAQSAPADPSPAMPGDEFYTIRQGDTFWALEEKFGFAHGTLQSLNPSQDPRTLQIGQQIRIRPAQQTPPQPQAAAPEVPAVPQEQRVTEPSPSSLAPAAAPAEPTPDPTPQPVAVPVTNNLAKQKHKLMIDIAAAGGMVAALGTWLLQNPQFFETVLGIVSTAILTLNRLRK